MSVEACPCGSGRSLSDCCARWHGGLPAPSAEALMRSRYSAFVLGLESYLRATWHISTRPQSLSLPDAQKWLGLSIKRHETVGDAAQVEFVARFRVGGGSAQRQHERSRFVREPDGRWYYVDGEML